MAQPTASAPLPAAQAKTLAELVNYADGAIVSRTLMQSAAGTLTLFAFDAGQGLSRHAAPFDAMVQVLEGEVDLIVGEQPVPATAGQVVPMPANVPHEIVPAGRFKMLLTMFKAQRA